MLLLVLVLQHARGSCKACTCRTLLQPQLLGSPALTQPSPTCGLHLSLTRAQGCSSFFLSFKPSHAALPPLKVKNGTNSSTSPPASPGTSLSAGAYLDLVTSVSLHKQQMISSSRSSVYFKLSKHPTAAA